MLVVGSLFLCNELRIPSQGHGATHWTGLHTSVDLSRQSLTGMPSDLSPRLFSVLSRWQWSLTIHEQIHLNAPTSVKSPYQNFSEYPDVSFSAFIVIKINSYFVLLLLLLFLNQCFVKEKELCLLYWSLDPLGKHMTHAWRFGGGDKYLLAVSFS